jgi:hypothetical protein
LKLPSWLAGVSKAVLVAGAIVAVLFLGANAKACLVRNPLATLNSSLPPTGPVVLPPTKEAERAPRVTEPVPVTRLVLPEKQRAAASKKYGVTVATEAERTPVKAGDAPALPPHTVDLVTEVKAPILPSGGDIAVTRDAAGAVQVIVKPKDRPFFGFGGIRETGIAYDPLRGSLELYHHQDLFRLGPAQLSLEGFVSRGASSLCLAGSCQEGTNYGVRLRAGVRW